MSTSFRQAQAAASDRCGVGLGLRWEFLDQVLEAPGTLPLRFFEISPENYMRRGGHFPEALERLRERYQFVSHGLTMSVGARDFPERSYLRALRAEIDRVGSPWHSDHLCLSTAGPLVLHELLPLPMNERTAQAAADRVRAIEDELGVPFAIENVSFYAHPEPPVLSEADFLAEVLHRSQAGLLLDVNNVYVNALNHGFDPQGFIDALPLEQVVQIHVAGHTRLPDDHLAAGMLLDTHGTAVIDPVKDLLQATLIRTGPVPVVLERDNDVPDLSELLRECRELSTIYDRSVGSAHAHSAEP